MTTEQVIGMMFIDFGAKEDRDRFKSYCLEFKKVDIEILKIAVQRCIRICKFLPTKAEIYKELEQLKEQAGGNTVKSWDDAWKEIYNGIDKYGSWNTPVWSTPEIERTVNAFGWLSLCATEVSDMPIVRAQMRDMYNSISGKEKSLKQTKNILEHKTGYEDVGINTNLLVTD